VAVPLPTPVDVLRARLRVGDAAARTPLAASLALAKAARAGEVRLKLEHLQPTGSFKVRGAESKVAAVAAAAGEQDRPRLVTASSGNHGIAVARAAARHGLAVTILVGGEVSPAKLGHLRELESDSCTVEIFGRNTDDTEPEARRRHDLGAAVYVPPYNDPEVVAGQGTVGIEILEDWPDVDTIVVPVGGGGLIGGIGTWVKAVSPTVRLIGVQPEASPPMHAFLGTGSTKRVAVAPTLADGVAGNVERGSITFRLVRRVVDDVLVVGEKAIAAAMRWAWDGPHYRLEGSAALGIAALLERRAGELTGRRVAVVLTGGNVDDTLFNAVMAGSSMAR
jgi:threonine dehydratase